MQAMRSSKALPARPLVPAKRAALSGGFALGGSGPANSQSTAWAAQGMIAIGTDPASITNGGNSALGYLLARQDSDGHFSYSSSSDQTPVWVTGQVAAGGRRRGVPGLAGAAAGAEAEAGAEQTRRKLLRRRSIPDVPGAPSTPTAPTPPSGGGGSGSGGRAPAGRRR